MYIKYVYNRFHVQFKIDYRLLIFINFYILFK